MSEPNGNAKPTATLSLVMDMLTHTIAVSGEAPNLETWLAMLAQATRQLELQHKIEGAKALQKQLQEQAENQRVVSMLRK